VLRRCAPPLASIAFVATCSLFGCSDSSKPRTPFTVWVFDARLALDGEDKPVSGARVALDPADGGERVTGTTEPDGHVTFEEDFTGGGASITVFSDDHVFTTMLEASPESALARPNGIGKPASDLVVFPQRLDVATARQTVALRGNIAGLKAPINAVTLSASSLPRLGTAVALTPTYALRAPRDRPFFVLGHALDTAIDPNGNVVSNDLRQSFRIDLPARPGDERLDVDLATVAPLPTRSLRLRAEVPAGTPFVAGTRAYASVVSADSGLTPGVFAKTTAAPDGRAFDIDMKLAETDVSPERLVTQAVLVAPDGSRSLRAEPGIVPSGVVWSDFAAPPSIPDPDASRTIRDAIPLDGFPAGADLLAEVRAGGQLVWVLHGPPGGPRAKTFAVPYRDEIASTDVQVFALSLAARTDRVALPLRGEFHRHASVSRDIKLRKR
jgi:hypothetical protein